MTNEEIFLFDEIKDDPSEEMENRAKSGSYIRRQPSIASGRRRGIYVSHISDLGSGAIVGAVLGMSRFHVLRANRRATFGALC
jgi:hypothetical protein